MSTQGVDIILQISNSEYRSSLHKKACFPQQQSQPITAQQTVLTFTMFTDHLILILNVF